MGFFDWLRGHGNKDAQAKEPAAAGTEAGAVLRSDNDGWEELPPYIPVDANDHLPALIISSSMAAGAFEHCAVKVRRVNVANPEHRLVSCIAAAIAAGAQEQSKLVVKHIYKQIDTEDANAA